MRIIELSPPPCSTESIPLFEAAVAKATGTQHALATSSGTAAIHLALLALGVGPGDVVLCSTLTFCASANPIVYCGATPVFIDCDASMQMDPYLLGVYLANNPRPKAVITVDLYGACCEYSKIKPLCAEYGVPIIEDAAESLGATRDGKLAGSFGTMGIVSFNLNKIVTSTGGGMLVSDDPALIETARFYATQAKEAAGWYQHERIGYNYRMPAAAAAHGLATLGQLQENIAHRQEIQSWYCERIPVLVSHVGSTCWLTTGHCHDPAVKIDRLKRHGIEARRIWKPLHMQPVYKGCRFENQGSSHSLHMFNRYICLPSVGVSNDEVNSICDIIEAYP